MSGSTLGEVGEAGLGKSQNPRGTVGQEGWGCEGVAEVTVWKMNKLGPNSFDFKHQPRISSQQAGARAGEAGSKSAHQ